MQTLSKHNLFGSGTTTASFTLPPGVGQIVCTRLGWDGPAAGTLAIYVASFKCKANAAVATSTALTIKTDASGYVEGYTPTSSDYVIVNNSTSGTTRWYLASISVVAAVSSSTRLLTLASNVVCAASDSIYIVSNSLGDIITFTIASESVRNVQDAFVGRRGLPVHILMSATGTNRFNGVYEIQD